MKRDLYAAALIAVAAFFLSILTSPLNSIMGVELEWGFLLQFLSGYGLFLLFFQLVLLLTYFTSIAVSVTGSRYLLTYLNIKRPLMHFIPAFAVWLLLLWGSAARHPQLYEDAFSGIATELLLFMTETAALIGPDIIYTAGWVLFGLLAFFFLKGPKNRRPDFSLLTVYLKYWGAALVVITLMTAEFRPQAEKPLERLHIWVGIDSLRYTELRNEKVMPTLHAFSERGIFFRDHHVSLPRTYPAFAAMLTGRPPSLNGIRHMFPTEADLDRFEQNDNLISALNKKGFSTLAAADFAGDIFTRLRLDWSATDSPHLDIREVISFQSLKTQYLLMPYLANYTGRRIFSALKELAEFSVPGYLVTDSINLLEKRRRRRAFMVVFFGTSHFPYSPPYPYYRKFTSEDYRGPFKFRKFIDPYKEYKVTAEDKKQIRNLFAASLNAVDGSLARLVSYLKAKGYWQRTVLHIFGDHGENLFEVYQDGSLYQGHGEHLRADHALKSPWIIVTGDKHLRESADWQQLKKLAETGYMTGQLDMYGLSYELATGEKLKTGHYGAGIEAMLSRNSDDIRFLAETGIWFSDRGEYSFQKQRIMYPSVSELAAADSEGNLYLRSSFADMIETAKFRSLDIESAGKKYRLIYRPHKDGAAYSFYRRGEETSTGWQPLPCRSLCRSAISRFRKTMNEAGFRFYENRVYLKR